MQAVEVFLQALVNGILRSGLYALTSVGLAMSVGVLRIVNFAHGEFLMLGAYLGVFLFVLFGMDPLVSLPVAAAALFALGMLIYRYTIKYVLDVPELNQMLLTFGISVFIQNVALILWSGDPRAINSAYRSLTLQFGDINMGVGRFLTFAIALIVLITLYLVLSRTRAGKAMRAVSQSRDGSGLVGIRVQRVYLCTFGLSAALAGMAGVMLSMVLYAQPAVGLEFTLKAFCIVVMAGLGNIGGVVWTSLLLGVAESMVGTFVPQGSGWSDGVFFILILAVLVVRSRGVAQWFAD